MSLEFVLIIIIISYLRKSLKMSVTMPVWNRRFMLLLYGSVAAAAYQIFFSKLNGLLQWFSIVALAALLYIINTNKAFQKAKFFITAVAPYLFVAFISELIKLINRNFFDTWYDWLNNASVFAVLWGIGVWFVTNRQRKELNKAQQKAKEEEENNRITTAMKAQLEIQVAERTAELTQQKNELENALSELKATQAQLIQSEKMASLGELTAGIAHEIQNPLNFVNNFAEVNSELIEEFKSEIVKNNSERDAQTESEILNDIAQNLTRIAFHGRRADSIVKGMLQHSRKNTGQKEPTDLNALCDEFLRLSYHGLRAKDKSFNADFKTSFDETIGKITIVPQNISRVLLNLFNNAFYAVNEKKKNYQSAAESDYKPLVMVTTRRIKSSQTEAAKSSPSGDGGAVEVVVKDNGSGISQAVIDKIFQPFFTTKPTGQGTGLGLSMSYDIITKEHGGKLTVCSGEGEYAEFIIELPFA